MFKDYEKDFNGNKFKIRVYNTKDYVLSFIYKPGLKLYYVSDDDTILHCNDSKQFSHLFLNRVTALNYVERLKIKFGIDFNVESYFIN